MPYCDSCNQVHRPPDICPDCGDCKACCWCNAVMDSPVNLTMQAKEP